MTQEMVYDPKTKQMVKDELYSYLYGPVQEHYQKRLETIIKKNSQRHGNQQKRLLFKTEVYELKDPGPVERPINPIHPELKPVMQEYVDDLTKLTKQELPYVLGFINQTLNASNSIKDYFKVFPESVHAPIQKLVDQCACKTEHLKPESVDKIKARNRIPIDLMKQRMVMNLLL